MLITKKEIDFLESIKYKLNNKEQEKIDEIIKNYNKYSEKNTQKVIKSRSNSKYLTEINKIRSLLNYYKKTRNFEKINELNKLQEEIKLKHKRGEI